MTIKRFISTFLTILTVTTAKGQVLTDGISGRDLKHALQFIQAFSPQSDTCLVRTDSLGRFEIDPELMELMRGYVYLKPIITKPRPKLALINPFPTDHRINCLMQDIPYRLSIATQNVAYNQPPEPGVFIGEMRSER